jgi:hypothetical protein
MALQAIENVQFALENGSGSSSLFTIPAGDVTQGPKGRRGK